MKKILLGLISIGAVLLPWSCSKGDGFWAGPWLSNEGHSGCKTSTDAEYLATKEWQTDSVVVTFDGSTIHIEHHNMVLDCNKHPMFNNYLTTEGDTLVVHEDVGEQGNTDCFCLYDNWMDVEGSPRHRYLRIVKEYSYLGNNDSVTVFESMFLKLSPQKQ